MLPASQNVGSDRFATRESSCPEFHLVVTNAVNYLAAGTAFFIAVIILSRRTAGGLTSQPTIFILFLAALVGGALMAAASYSRSQSSFAPRRLVAATRFSVLVTLVTLGIWPPLFSAANLVTFTLVVSLALLPLRRMQNRELSFVPSPPYWTAVISLQTVHKNMLNLLQIRHGKSDSFTEKKNDAIRWWKIFRREDLGTKQFVPLENLSSEQAIFRSTTRHQADLEGTLLQWQERYELPDGTECLRGQLMIDFSPGTRLTTGHVGFCPSFPSIPVVQVATDYDALEVSVTAAEILPWGVRIECRVEEPIDEGTSIPVSLTVNKPLQSSTSSPHNN